MGAVGWASGSRTQATHHNHLEIVTLEESLWVSTATQLDYFYHSTLHVLSCRVFLCGQIATQLFLQLCRCTVNSEDRTTAPFREAAGHSVPINKLLSCSFCKLLIQFRSKSFQMPLRWKVRSRYLHAKFELLPHQRHKNLFSRIFSYFVLCWLKTSGKFTTCVCFLGAYVTGRCQQLLVQSAHSHS